LTHLNNYCEGQTSFVHIEHGIADKYDRSQS
jgi:hypothetical protein